MKNSTKTPIVWRGIATLFATLLCLGIPFLSGCMTLSQSNSALVQGGGQAYGAYYLTQNSVNGVVNPAVLAQYERNLVGIYYIMQNGMDAFTFENIVAQVTHSSSVSPAQAGAIGFLSSVNSTFIRANSSPLTADGAAIQAAAQQLATGLAAAVEQVTGAAFVIPTNPAPSAYRDTRYPDTYPRWAIRPTG